MQNRCKEALLNIQISGTRVDKKIAEKLLDNDVQKKISKIVDISEICDVSVSTASRFITKIHYPSFKHFIYEYSNEMAKKNEIIDENGDEVDASYIQEITEKSHNLISHVKGDIFTLTSRRGKSIGKMLHERLNDAKVKNFLFRESKDNVEEFVKSSAGNTLILVSLSGYSNVFSKAIHEIAKLDEKDKPNVIILTAAVWMNIFEKYEYISLGKLKKKKYDLDEWKDYNYALLDIMSTLIVLLNDIHDRYKHTNE